MLSTETLPLAGADTQPSERRYKQGPSASFLDRETKKLWLDTVEAGLRNCPPLSTVAHVPHPLRPPVLLP